MGPLSAYTQVKIKDAPELFHLLEEGCLNMWIRIPKARGPQQPVVPLERNPHGHPLAGLVWERTFEKVLIEEGWEEVAGWECLQN